MTDLLIHSLSEFAWLVLPCLEQAGARHVVEIGAEYGGMSQHLGDHCARHGGRLTSIDPSPKPEFLDWVAGASHVEHLAETSLEALPKLSDVDAYVIDGDHNYYTVAHELRLAQALSHRDGKPLLAFLHDVGWPCARRDQYCAPDTIPAAHRHPHSFTAGITLGDPGHRIGRGFRGAGHWAAALTAGGPRNGVLTAVEDFLEETRQQGETLVYAHVPAVFGLGVLFDAQAPFADALAFQLAPWHDNPLLATLEANRLRNYLAVIEWQDSQAGASILNHAA
jgi:hypothetical protein